MQLHQTIREGGIGRGFDDAVGDVTQTVAHRLDDAPSRDLQSWIETDLASITGALDELLVKTGTDAGSVDKIFLTGGTSFVPAVRRIFTERFAAGRIESGGELISIAHGLALIGERDDIEQWTVPGTA